MPTPTDPNFNYLAVEDALIARLKAEVPEFADVRSEASLDGMKGAQLPTPCALVLWSGDSVISNENPSAQMVQQTWMVCIVAKAAGDRTGEITRDIAGPLLTKTILAVRGWSPDPATFDYFRWAESVQPELVPGGVLYVPLVFQTAFVI